MANNVRARPPARLRALLSWQTGKVNTVGTRLFAARLPLSARGDFAVLAALDEAGPLSQAELGRRLGLDRNEVSGVVDRLEAEGRVVRQADPSDRRRNRVSMTSEGSRYLGDIQRISKAVQAELAANLDADEIRVLRSLLAKLLDAHPSVPS